MKRAIIVHGWASHDQDGWFPWLKQELESRGFRVDIPNMPHPLMPTIKDWVDALAKAAGSVDSETVLIGHSIGCQTILRYLETIDTPVRGAVFVAGFIKDLVLDPGEGEEIAAPWLQTPIDFDKLKTILPRSVAIFSDNDRFVPVEENVKIFKERIGSEIVIEHAKKHFAGDQGFTELPNALEAVIKISA